MLVLSVLMACGLQCADVPLPDLLLIEPSAADWPSGTYRFEVEDSDTFASWTCEVVLPGADQPCADGISVARVSDDAIMRLEAWSFTPDRALITVSLDGELRFEEERVPDYTESAPSGEDCGVQRAGGVEVSW